MDNQNTYIDIYNSMCPDSARKQNMYCDEKVFAYFLSLKIKKIAICKFEKKCNVMILRYG